MVSISFKKEASKRGKLDNKKPMALPNEKRPKNGRNKHSHMAVSPAREHPRCKMRLLWLRGKKKKRKEFLKMCDSYDTISGGDGNQNELWELHLTDNSAMAGTPKQQEGNQAEKMSQATKLGQGRSWKTGFRSLGAISQKVLNTRISPSTNVSLPQCITNGCLSYRKEDQHGS